MQVIPLTWTVWLKVSAQNKNGKKDALCLMELKWREDAFKEALTIELQ